MLRWCYLILRFHCFWGFCVKNRSTGTPAAGAGYVTERLKNLTMGKQSCSDLSSGSMESQGKRSGFFRRELSRKSFEAEMCREREQACKDSSAVEMTSTSGYERENPVLLNNAAGSSTVSNSISLAVVDIQGDWEGRTPANIREFDSRDSSPQPSPRATGFSYGCRRNSSSLRSRKLNSQFIKPQSSLESCLMAQLYKQHADFEDYTYYTHPPQKAPLRPFHVIDEARITSGEINESLSEPTELGKYKLQNDTTLEDSKTILGVPRLPNILPMELQKKDKSKTGKRQVLMSNYNERVHRNNDNGQGSCDEAFLFYLGLSMGMVSSILTNKREMEKLNKLLKQTENLVQDLQEELEMKESLTVKELAVEDYESRDLHDGSYSADVVNASSRERKLDNSPRSCAKELRDQDPDEESMSNIEAELEAELERLESNINSSRLEQRLSNIAEANLDRVSDVLQADLFGAKNGTQPYADRDGSGSSTPHSARYPVCPKDLSLRLHEVIQSRLEERVKELEMALHESQRKVNDLESEHIRPRDFSNHKTRTSTQESPVARDKHHSVDQPVVINLTGEALSSYNEAFNKLSDTDDEDLQLGFVTSDHQEIFHQCKQVIDQVQNGGINGYMERLSVSNETPEMAIYSNDGTYASRDENEDADDEMEKLLIRQIVEKARQGSPALLAAQRSLLSSSYRK